MSQIASTAMAGNSHGMLRVPELALYRHLSGLVHHCNTYTTFHVSCLSCGHSQRISVVDSPSGLWQSQVACKWHTCFLVLQAERCTLLVSCRTKAGSHAMNCSCELRLGRAAPGA